MDNKINDEALKEIESVFDDLIINKIKEDSNNIYNKLNLILKEENKNIENKINYINGIILENTNLNKSNKEEIDNSINILNKENYKICNAMETMHKSNHNNYNNILKILEDKIYKDNDNFGTVYSEFNSIKKELDFQKINYENMKENISEIMEKQINYKKCIIESFEKFNEENKKLLNEMQINYNKQYKIQLCLILFLIILNLVFILMIKF